VLRTNSRCRDRDLDFWLLDTNMLDEMCCGDMRLFTRSWSGLSGCDVIRPRCDSHLHRRENTAYFINSDQAHAHQ